MGLKKLFITLILSLALLPVTPVMAEAATVSDISKRLVCQCGCTSVLSECLHAECGVGVPMKALIGQMLAQGQSGEQIIQLFVARYGEVVLASPPKRGFNLVAWILPFAAILGGGGVIYFALKKWVRQGRRSQISAMTEEGDEEYRQRLEKELEEFTEEGFR